MSGIYHENKLWANVSGPNVAGATPSENLSTLTIDGVTYDTTELVFCYDDNGSLYTDSTKATAVSGDDSKLYIATNTGKQYRYNGSAFSALGVNAINDLSDVTITSASDGQALEYDATAGKWKNVAKKAADTPTFSEASTRANLSGSGETMTTILGKIKKFFSDLKTVAFSGSYNDLSNKPTLATVATSGSYNDLSNKPTIPTVNNGTLTIQKNGTQVATFSANQSGNATANITVPEVEETDTTNSTPYLYRASQNSGDRCYLRQLVGASFGVNQLQAKPTAVNSFYANNCASVTFANDTITFTASAKNGNVNLYPSRMSIIAGHKYLMRASIKAASTNVILVPVNSGTYASVSKVNTFDLVEKIFNANSDMTTYLEVRDGRSTGWDQIQAKDFQLIDLTQYFGISIADKAYTMEQTTSESGIAWLKSYGFFTESYYPYSTGLLQSVQTSGKVNTEENLFDPSQLFEVSGLTENNGEYVFSKADMIAVFGDEAGGGFYPRQFAENTQYTISLKCYNERNGFTLYFRHTDGTTISQSTYASSWASFTFTSTAGKTVEKLYFSYPSYGTVHWKEIQFEKGSTATPYKPYTPHTTQLPNIELRGVAQLIGNDIVYDGDIENADGSVERKYGIVDLGSLSWTKGGQRWSASVSNAKWVANNQVCKIVAEKYTADTASRIYTGTVLNTIGIEDGNKFAVYNNSNDAPTGYAVYELATPTTEQTTPIQNPQIYNSNGTEQFIDNRTVPIPVGHNSEYVNLPDWLEDGYYKDFRQRVDEHIGSDGNFNGNALTATLATKATQDGDGNNISSTYWKKTQYPKTGKSAGGSATAATTGYRDVKTIEVDQGGVFLVIAFVKFSGGTGRRAVLITNSNDNPYAQTWDDSTIASGDTKQIVCCHNLVVSDSSVPIQIKLRVYTANNDTTSISGTIAFIRLQ